MEPYSTPPTQMPPQGSFQQIPPQQPVPLPESPLPNKNRDTKLIIVALALIVLAVVIVVVALIFLLKDNRNQTSTDEAVSKTTDIDCSHQAVNIKQLTGETNPNILDSLSNSMRTDSEYLCIEDWGVAIKLPNNISSVIYTPVDNGQSDYSFHRMYILGIVDNNGKVNWGGNYMPDSYFSGLATIERIEPDRLDFAKLRGVMDDSDIFLKTDNYVYFVVKGRGKDLVDTYKQLASYYSDEFGDPDKFSIPEGFYDDIESVGNWVNSFDNYLVYDKSKS